MMKTRTDFHDGGDTADDNSDDQGHGEGSFS